MFNGAPGVGKSSVARRVHAARPLSLLVDFDDLRLLISQWHERDEAPRLAAAAGLAMARVHLEAGQDVIAAQFSVRPRFFSAVDAVVADTSAELVEVFLVAQPECVAGRFRQRREARETAGHADVGGDIPTDRIDEVARWATQELDRVISARTNAIAVDASEDLESTHTRVLEALAAEG